MARPPKAIKAKAARLEDLVFPLVVITRIEMPDGQERIRQAIERYPFPGLIDLLEPLENEIENWKKELASRTIPALKQAP